MPQAQNSLLERISKALHVQYDEKVRRCQSAGLI